MSGSNTSVWINGITYNAKADSDFSAESERETEGVKHSGGTAKKVTLKPAMVSGIDLIVTDEEYKTLLEVDALQGKYPVGFEKQDGSVWDAPDGFMTIDTYTTSENVLSISLTADKEWDITPA